MSLRRALVVGTTVGLLGVVGCTSAPETDSGPPLPSTVQPRVSPPLEQTLIVNAANPVRLAVDTSQTLFDHAPVVVLAGAGEPAGWDDAAALAVDLSSPLLLAPVTDDPGDPDAAAVRQELRRLDPRVVVPADPGAERWAGAAGGDIPVVAPGDDVPAVLPASGMGSLVVLTTDDDDRLAATATARAAGARVVVSTDPDPRADADAVAALGERSVGQLIALGDGFGSAERLRYRVEVAATGVQLPGGGQVMLPGRRMIALYGHPGNPVLGVLGEQPVDEAIARAEEVAAPYRDLVDEPVVPVFELITTIAAAAPGPDETYSTMTPVEQLRPWVDAAGEAGVYVVLDLQPGLTDFLTQARAYEELLREPHVGLALDPEWRLAPGQRHLEQIGSVDAAEVNRVSDWLAQLTRENRLPQKLLVLHQFRLSMITDRENLDTSHEELAILIHADGHGTPGQKMETWDALRRDAPEGVWWGWKNFYDEDDPTFSPAETFEVDPSPVFVSYQ